MVGNEHTLMSLVAVGTGNGAWCHEMLYYASVVQLLGLILYEHLLRSLAIKSHTVSC